VRRILFVAPFAMSTTMRFVRAVARLPDVALGLITQEPLDRLPEDLRRGLAGHWKVDDCLDPRQIVTAARGVTAQLGGPVQTLLGVLEQLQVPLADARAALGLPGLSPEAARNFRDKSRMKTVLRQAGLPCARHRLAHDAGEMISFVEEVGLPVVVKPPSGAGAQGTHRLDRPGDVEQAARLFRPSRERPVMLEEFLRGAEHSFDSVVVGGRRVWHSVSRYLPGPLEVLQNPWIQWAVLLPRDIDGGEYEDLVSVAERAVRVLGLETGLSHMEWFRLPDGRLAISEVGARPPGAQITSLLSWAHDTDMYEAWARLMVYGEFRPPERKWAVGAAYLRGQGRGRVKAVHGLEQAQREMGELVVEVSLPEPGQPRASGYEGEGYVILRHPRTEVVEKALLRAVSLLRVELEP
jgi:hypothetical protein